MRYGKGAMREKKLPAGVCRRMSVFFLAGFLGGLIAVFAGRERLVANTFFLDQVSVKGVGALEIDRRSFLLYCLGQRIRPAALLVLASAAGMGGAASCLFLLWSGLCAGVVLSVLSIRYGIAGVILFAGGILPQVLLLAPAFWFLCGWCISSRPKRDGLPLLVFGVILCGCVLEGYANPTVMKYVFLLLSA